MSKDFETMKDLIEGAALLLDEGHVEGCECNKCHWLKHAYVWLYPEENGKCDCCDGRGNHPARGPGEITLVCQCCGGTGRS